MTKWKSICATPGILKDMVQLIQQERYRQVGMPNRPIIQPELCRNYGMKLRNISKRNESPSNTKSIK